MPVCRRFPVIVLALAVGAVLVGTVVAMVAIRAHRPHALTTPRPNEASGGGPRAVVDKTPWELGVIDLPEEFDHKFVIRNEGTAPLQLRQGPSECACTVSELPHEPVPPGGRAEIRVNFSQSAQKDALKPGPFEEGIYVVTNDPQHEAIELKMTATVRRRLIAEPSPLVFNLQWSDLAAADKRSADTWIYSQRWEHFELEGNKPSWAGLTWQIEAATPQRLEELQARSGYRVAVTLPPEVPDGEFRGTLEFSAKPADAEEPPRTLELGIQGKVQGHLVFSGPKITGNQVLSLGMLFCGTPVRERVLLKVNEPPRALTIEAIETEPKFLRARVEPYNSESAAIGLYRIEIEIPPDAPSGDFSGAHQGVIRIRTDHPRFAVIKLTVDFILVAARGPLAHP
jgi:hypothetical protein